jgi:hypothetical protein
MMKRNEYVEIDIDEIVRDDHRDMAILIRIDKEELWIPRSVIQTFRDQAVTVQEWWAIKEGLV